MKERPILFNGAMVRAILAGTKTQTRRVMKAVKHPDFGNLYEPSCMAREEQHAIERACPYGQPGDRLWVRETWQGPLLSSEEFEAHGNDDPGSLPIRFNSPAYCEYAADGRPAPEFMTADDELVRRWRPSIHMPRWASRITLEITSVRVERLHEISEADAAAEGMQYSTDHIGPWSGTGERWWYSARLAFKDLWLSITGPESWDANPWVWVVDFKRVEATP